MKDSLKVLRKCESEGKQALCWIEQLMDETENMGIKRLLARYEAIYDRFCRKVNQEILYRKKKEKWISGKTKAGIFLKLHTGLLLRHTDSEIAELLSDACFDQTKQLCRVLNTCPQAEEKSISLAQELIRIQQGCTEELRPFL